MSETADSPAETIRTWMLDVMRELQMTPPQWAKLAGVAASTIQRAIKPDYEFVTSSRTLAKLASPIGRSPPEVRQARDLQYVPRFLQVRYKVQAGNWLETDAEAQIPIDAPGQPVAPDPRYAEFPQWLELVVGESVNRKMQSGDFAHVVDAIAMLYEPQDDDWVVVERTRAGGLLRERTIKQVVLTPAGIELWPRSTDPRWQTPIRILEGVRENEDVEVTIVGKVIGAYSAF